MDQDETKPSSGLSFPKAATFIRPSTKHKTDSLRPLAEQSTKQSNPPSDKGTARHVRKIPNHTPRRNHRRSSRPQGRRRQVRTSIQKCQSPTCSQKAASTPNICGSSDGVQKNDSTVAFLTSTNGWKPLMGSTFFRKKKKKPLRTRVLHPRSSSVGD